MAFVNGCFLVQVARPGATGFDRESLLVDGLFLGYKARDAKRAGFERAGRATVSLSDIEFPCWLIEESRRGVLFCRGELVWPVSGPRSKEVYARWDVRLSPKYPAQLADSLNRLLTFAGRGAPFESPRRLLGIPGSDVRYHPERGAILQDTGVDVSKPYWKEIDRVEPSRIDIYRKAIEASQGGLATRA